MPVISYAPYYLLLLPLCCSPDASHNPLSRATQETTECLLTYIRPEDFTTPRLPPHLQIYTWQTCTLSELTHLLLTALPSLVPSQYAGTRIAFRLIYADMQGPNRPGQGPHYLARELGSVIVGAKSVDSLSEDKVDVDMDRDDGDDVADGEQSNAKDALKQLAGETDKTLQSARFVIGDYICASILPPNSDGSVAVAPPPPPGPSARGPPPRESYGLRGGGRDNGYGSRGRGGDDFPYGGRGGRGGGRGGPRFDDRDRRDGGLPSGEWRRGEAPPERERDSYGRGSGGYSGGGRGRGRGRW